VSLAHPEWLLLLGFLPLLAWILLKRQPKGLPLSTYGLLDAEAGKRARRNRLLTTVLRLGAIACLALTLAKPQAPGRWIEEKQLGIDLMLALDVSGSMRAEDFQPENRLAAAKRVLKDFVQRNSQNRIGLVAFAGRSVTLSPLTTDTPVVQEAIDRIRFGVAGQDGTAIGDGIGNSLYRLEDQSAKSRVIVLLSDGENNSGYLQPLQAAAMAKAKGVKIYTIAVGKPGGAAVPAVDRDGREIVDPRGQKVYIRNRDGSLFLTAMDEAELERIATLTGGRYFRATDTPALEAAYAEIAKLERTELPSTRRRAADDRTAWPLGIGLLMVALEALISRGNWLVLQGGRHIPSS
jgi:Ca-activated chloride channel family protein